MWACLFVLAGAVAIFCAIDANLRLNETKGRLDRARKEVGEVRLELLALKRNDARLIAELRRQSIRVVDELASRHEHEELKAEGLIR